MKRVSKLVLLSTVGIFLSVQASIASSQLDDALENGAKRLSSSEIAKQFVGKTVRARSGKKEFLFFYSAKNVLAGKLVNGGWSGSGYYGITDDNSICISMKQDKGRLRCLTVIQDNAGIKKFDVGGKMTFELLEFQDGDHL